MNGFVKALLDLLFPLRCLICYKSSEKAICEDCIKKVQYIKPPFCKICGKPRDSYFKFDLCEDCADRKPHFNLARSVGIYEGALKKAIHKFKFKNKKNLAKELSMLVVEYLNSDKTSITIKNIDGLIAVPLHPKRLKDRGYNQSELLLDELSSFFKVPIVKDVMVRTKETKPQFELLREDRLNNVKDAFRVIDNRQIIGKNILLIDDIYTTGSTVSECSKALKDALAGEVYVLTLSRAVE